MLYVFQAVTGGEDWAVLYSDLEMGGVSLQCFLILYIVFFVIAVWNIVTSVFIEKAFTFAIPDIEALILQKDCMDVKDAEDLNRLFKKLSHGQNLQSTLTFLC